MTKSEKIGSEITVRISLTFQDAPDVHTLLAATPVRDRGKLVRFALERYIVTTNHPAGNVDSQIEAVSQWLRNRASTPPTCLEPFSEGSQKEMNSPDCSNQGTFETDSLIHQSEQYRLGQMSEQLVNLPRTATTDNMSTSIRRWLTD